MTEPVLRLEHVSKRFSMAGGAILSASVRADVVAVRDVSFDIHEGEIVGLIGASGSGKTTTGRIALRLIDPTSGRVWFRGQEITHLRGRSLRRLRRGFQMVFQDPYQSLNARMAVRRLLEEPLEVHLPALGPKDRMGRIEETLERVGLRPASAYMGRYPHELSGGQRQRVAIGRAVITEPSLLVADEPVSMLDVSVRAGLLRLLLELRDRLGAAQLFVTHDLAVARQLCDRVVVMSAGSVVEEGPALEVLHRPAHPYTRSLLDALPERRRRVRSA